jgi:uncharacterized alpha-E superfamily protein
MPRSLAFCVSKLCDNLGYLADEGDDAGLPSRQKVGALENGLLSKTIDDIFDHGLHEFLQDTLKEITSISRQIEEDFRFYA